MEAIFLMINLFLYQNDKNIFNQNDKIFYSNDKFIYISKC